MKRKKIIRILLGIFLLSAGFSPAARAQFYSVRGNGLLLLTGTLNVGCDIALTQKTSFDLGVYANPIKTEKLSLMGFGLQPGIRFWRFEPNAGTFWGVHLSGAWYDIGNKSKTRKGFLIGPGFSWGHCWLISKRFTIGLELGAGLLYMQDTKRARSTPYTEDEYIYHSKRLTVAPTKADVSFVYLF